MKANLYCSISGLALGSFVALPSRLAGSAAIRVASGWKEANLQHPVFSLTLPELLDRRKRELETEDKQLLFLALLQYSGCLQLDRGYRGLPPVEVAIRYMHPVVAVLKWVYYLDSKLLKLPGFRINALSDWAEVCKAWVYACQEVRQEWDRASDRNLIKAKRSHATRIITRQLDWQRPLSFDHLFTWAVADTSQALLQAKVWRIVANSSQRRNWPSGAFAFWPRQPNDAVRFQISAEQYYRDLFTGAVPVELREDIEGLENLIYLELEEDELGSRVSAQVSKRLAELKAKFRDHQQVYEILDSVLPVPVPAPRVDLPALNPADYPTRFEYLLAKARQAVKGGN